MKRKQLNFYYIDFYFRKTLNENSYSLPESNFRIVDEKTLDIQYKDKVMDWQDIISLRKNKDIKKELINEMTPIGKQIVVEYEKFIKSYKNITLQYNKHTQKLYRRTLEDNNKYFTLMNI